MNERRKSEGELLESVFSDDDRSHAQKLLDRCKEIERRRNMKVIRVSNFTWYLLPQETNIENWKARKFV